MPISKLVKRLVWPTTVIFVIAVPAYSYISYTDTNGSTVQVSTTGAIATYLNSLGVPTPVSIANPMPTTGGGGASGSVSVSNFPATQPVSGAVAVSNFPATMPVNGSVSVSNLPTTQAISGTVTVSPNRVAPVSSSAAESAHILKSAAGTLYSVYAVNYGTTAGFLEIINSATIPTTGSTITPTDCIPIPASGTGKISYDSGVAGTYTSGIVALISSSTDCTTYTSGTITGFISGEVQ